MPRQAIPSWVLRGTSTPGEAVDLCSGRLGRPTLSGRLPPWFWVFPVRGSLESCPGALSQSGLEDSHKSVSGHLTQALNAKLNRHFHRA